LSKKKKDRSDDSYSRSGEEKGPVGEIRRWQLTGLIPTHIHHNAKELKLLQL
jgi:hypothetical protein